MLAQLERLDEFVFWRKQTAKAFDEVVRGCSWLKPQHVGVDYEHSYWAYVVKLDAGKDGVTWQPFFDKFAELGGDGFYGAWSLTYLEPVFQDGSLGHRFEAGICPVAEATQPQLMQLKTNYGDQETIDRQAEALREPYAISTSANEQQGWDGDEYHRGKITFGLRMPAGPRTSLRVLRQIGVDVQLDSVRAELLANGAEPGQPILGSCFPRP